MLLDVIHSFFQIYILNNLKNEIVKLKSCFTNLINNKYLIQNII